MKIENDKRQYINLPTVPEHIQLDIKKYYGYDISESDMKFHYYRGIIDIENNILEAGQEVYYVSSKVLGRGTIDEIIPIKPGFIFSRIVIKGDPVNVEGHMCVLIKEK